MMVAMSIDCMATYMQIGLEVSQTRKNTLGRCFCLGSAMISWFSRKQSSVVLSTVEVEYIAA